MPNRLKKIFGALFICAFVIVWIFGAVTLSGLVPDNRVAELVFYAVAGMGWGVPLLPILAWMERSKEKPKP
jgi:hypothetical protein